MSTDHYAEAKVYADRMNTTPAEAALVHATLALVDAVRALKAGATVPTTHADLTDALMAHVGCCHKCGHPIGDHNERHCLRECPCKAKEARRG